jgi:hypothetical protein
MLPLLLLAGLGAGAAGTFMQYKGQQRAAKATANVWNQFRQRNQQREADAANVWSQNLKKSGADTANSEMAQGEQKRLAGYNRMDAVGAPAAMPRATTGNRVIATPTTASRASVKNAGSAWSKLLGGAQAKLGGVQQWQMNQQVRDNTTERELNRITRESRGDMNNVVPAQLNDASRKGDALMGWGSLVSSLGKLAGTAGGLNGGGGAGGVAERASVFQENPALGDALTGQGSMLKF